MSDLKKAKKEGKFHETLLDRWVAIRKVQRDACLHSSNRVHRIQSSGIFWKTQQTMVAVLDIYSVCTQNDYT